MARPRFGFRPWRVRTGLGVTSALFPGVVLAGVVLVDLLTPGLYYPFSPPMVAVVPALAAATSGIWGSAAYTLISAVVSVLVIDFEGPRESRAMAGMAGNEAVLVYSQLTALAIMFIVSLVPGYLRSRRERTVRRLRSVSETVQRAVLVPIPERNGCLRVSAGYLAAEEEAQLGGDLYDVLDTPFGTRMIIGDVRGKGLPAVASATNLLGAFREGAPYVAALPDLAERLEDSVRRHRDRAGLGAEDFITATLVSIPARAEAEVMCCGHPGPFLIRSGGVTEVVAARPSPPLGVGATPPGGHHVDTIPFEPGDRLLLFTDGVTEARDVTGRFYPLFERLAAWTDVDPYELVQRLVHDVTDHTGSRLSDDAALLASRRETLTSQPDSSPATPLTSASSKGRGRPA